jgi:hypothetical protein
LALALVLATGLSEVAAGSADGDEAGALVCAAAGVEMTDSGMANTAALARMESNFFMEGPGIQSCELPFWQPS